MTERGVVEYVTFSGVTLYVTPLAVATINAIVARSEAEFPDVDDTPYRVEIPHSAVPGQTVLDDQNPEYQRLAAEVAEKRRDYQNERFYRLGIEFAERLPDLKRRYKDRIEQLRQALALVDVPDEDILLFHIALARNADYKNVTSIIQDRMPLTEGEVADGLKIFRPELSRNGLLAASKPARGISGAES